MAIRSFRRRLAPDMLFVFLSGVMAVLSTSGAMAEENPVQTMTAFNTTVYYQYSCVKDIFRIAVGAWDQLATGGESALYWEIWRSGERASQGVETVASINTLPVQGAGSAPQPNGFPLGSYFIDVYRPCTGQSLYLWAASDATTLEGGNVILRFSDASERPLP